MAIDQIGPKVIHNLQNWEQLRNIQFDNFTSNIALVKAYSIGSPISRPINSINQYRYWKFS